MAETAVIARPSASRLIINSLCLKLLVGLSGAFFCVFRIVRDLGFGLAFSLTPARWRGGVGLFMQASYLVPASSVAHKLSERYSIKTLL
jgi:hypothetical protein